MTTESVRLPFYGKKDSTKSVGVERHCPVCLPLTSVHTGKISRRNPSKIFRIKLLAGMEDSCYAVGAIQIITATHKA